MDSKQESALVHLMIRLYCKKNHHHRLGLCPDCQALYEYALFRKSKCPFRGQNTFCNTCPVHCYRPDMREAIRKVMRFSGPRLLFIHPIVALRHMVLTLRFLHRQKKERTVLSGEADRV